MHVSRPQVNQSWPTFSGTSAWGCLYMATVCLLKARSCVQFSSMKSHDAEPALLCNAVDQSAAAVLGHPVHHWRAACWLQGLCWQILPVQRLRTALHGDGFRASCSACQIAEAGYPVDVVCPQQGMQRYRTPLGAACGGSPNLLAHVGVICQTSPPMQLRSMGDVSFALMLEPGGTARNSWPAHKMWHVQRFMLTHGLQLHILACGRESSDSLSGMIILDGYKNGSSADQGLEVQG